MLLDKLTIPLMLTLQTMLILATLATLATLAKAIMAIMATATVVMEATVLPIQLLLHLTMVMAATEDGECALKRPDDIIYKDCLLNLFLALSCNICRF